MRSTLIHYIYIILLLFTTPIIAQNATSQIRIFGKVTDVETKESLPYVSIRISGSTLGCSSDNYGNFSFYLPTLKDTLIVSSIGYKEMRIPLTKKTKLPIKVKMRAESYMLSEITIKP